MMFFSLLISTISIINFVFTPLVFFPSVYVCPWVVSPIYMIYMNTVYFCVQIFHSFKHHQQFLTGC